MCPARAKRATLPVLLAGIMASLLTVFPSAPAAGGGEREAGAERPAGEERKDDGIEGDVGVAPPVTALVFAPEAKEVLCGSQAGIEARGWPGLERSRRLETSLAHVHDLAFAPGGKLLAAAGGTPGREGIVEVFGWPEGQRLRVARVREGVVYSLSWNPDGESWACGAHDAVVSVHRASDGRELEELRGHSRPVLAVRHVSEETLVTAGIDRSLRVWDLRRGERIRALENHTGAVLGLALRPSRDEGSLPLLVSIGEDRTLRFWQPTIGRLVRFARLPATPLAVDWTANGAHALVSADDGRLRFVDPATVEVVEELPALEGWAYAVAASPASPRDVAVGGEGGRTVRVKLEEGTRARLSPENRSAERPPP